jgi:hypothetical protein
MFHFNLPYRERVKQKASQVQETIVIVNAYVFFLLLTTELVILNKYYNQY